MEARATRGIAVDINGCARCGQDHETLLFNRLTNPQDEYEWWAFCPITREPLLVKITMGEAPKQPTPEEIQKLREEEERGRERGRRQNTDKISRVSDRTKG